MVSHRGTPLVIEGPAALELSIQLSFRSELQDEVNARRVVEVTVQTQDIGMSGRDGEFTTHRNYKCMGGDYLHVSNSGLEFNKV